MKKLLLSLFAIAGLSFSTLAQVTYCEPTFTNGCFSWNNKEITLDSINWVLGSGDCTISDYTSMRTTLSAGVATPMTILNGSWCGVGVWIDYNTDGAFDSTENLYYMYTAGNPQTYSFLLTVPTSVPDGDYRMRVIAGWGTDCYTTSANGYGACGAYEYGNFDDFTVGVVGGGVGISENSMSDIGFTVYPDPAVGQLNVEVNSNLVGSSYSITDQLGKEVLAGKMNFEKMKIEIAGLSHGIYLIKIGESSRKTIVLN